MPVLKTYTSPIAASPISGGRRAEGSDLAPDLGSVSAAVRKTADAYLDFNEEQESRAALIQTSQIRAKYARRLDEAQLSGGDLAKLKEEMVSELAKVGEGFQTKRGADSLALYTSNNELMFDEQANRINIQRASVQARVDGANFLNSEAATLRSNPSYLPFAEKNIEAFGATLTKVPTHLRDSLVAEWKQSINMSAALASARLDPEATRKRLDGGEWNLKPEQREAAIGKTEEEIRARRAEERYQHQLVKEAEQERDELARDKHAKLVLTGKASRREILDDPDLKPTTREHLVLLMDHRAKEMAGQEKKSDPRVLRDLFLRINAPEDDPRKIRTGDEVFKAAEAGGLNVRDATFLFAQVAGQRDENNRTVGQRVGAMSQIVQAAFARDPQFAAQPALVAEIQNDWNARVLQRISEIRKSGGDEGVSQIFDPTSKNYVGSREFIQESVNTAKERMKQAATANIPHPKSEAEYEALPTGTTYIDTDGAMKIKKGKQKVSGKVKEAPAVNLSDVTAP